MINRSVCLFTVLVLLLVPFKRKTFFELTKELKNTNLKLWYIEDKKRELEKKQEFGKEFIELARNVYKSNDERAKIKLKINEALGSNIKEVKSYE